MMQSYPSPTGAATDGAPFYSSSGQQPGISSTDDIRIGMQLRDGLTPIMNAGNGGTIPDGPDPRNHANIGHQYDHVQDPNAHAQHMQSSHGPMDQMAMQYGSPDGSMAPRKRSKVSRACDECRRKKIRCDATGEPGDEQCSSCRRVGSRCQFSRVPMKRGPSKGYIKELADRLHNLEGAIQQQGELPVQQYLPQHDSPLQTRPSDDFSPPPTVEGATKKRTYSSVSGEFGSPYQPHQRSLSSHGWSSQDAQRNTPHPPPSYAMPPQPTPGSHPAFREPSYSPNGLQHAAPWKPEPPRRQSSSFEGMMQITPSQSERTSEWDDAVVDGYYNLIHHTFPLLPQNKGRLHARLANCDPTLREAFHESLHAAVRSFPSQSLAAIGQQSTKRATQLIAASQFETISSRPFSTNLIYLQTMMLLAIEAGNQPPNSARGHSGSFQSICLGSAVGLANYLKLHMHKQPEKNAENDHDSDDKVARRIWWSIVMMDRWHSSSRSTPLLIPDASVVVYAEEQSLLGEHLYQLTRLTIMLGHFAEANLVHTDLPPLGVRPASIVGTLLRGEMERWRESLPASFFPSSQSPLNHICYWHLRILLELTRAESEPLDLLAPAMHIVTQLKHNAQVISPLTYYSTALAAFTLLELMAYQITKEDAESGLKSLLEARIAPSGWDAAIRDMIVTKQQRLGASAIVGSSNLADSQHALTASQGLQRLADLATATEERRDVSSGEGRKDSEKTDTVAAAAHSQRYHELRELVRSGYLTVFDGEAAR